MRWVVRGPNIILKQRRPSGFSPLYGHHKWILHTHFLWSICITVLTELHEFIIRCRGLVRHRMTLGYLGAHLICQYYAMFLALTCLLFLPVDLQSLLYMSWCAQCCLRVFVVTNQSKGFFIHIFHLRSFCLSTDQTLQCPSKVRSHRQSSWRGILVQPLNDIIQDWSLISKEEGEQLARAINL